MRRMIRILVSKVMTNNHKAASQRSCYCIWMPTKYLEKILKARVYDVAIETPLDVMRALSARLDNHVLLKREDVQPVCMLGGKVVLHGDTYDEAFGRAVSLADENGMVNKQPNNDPEVIA